MPEVDASSRDQLLIPEPPSDAYATQLVDRRESGVAEMSMECCEPLHSEPQKAGRPFLLETLDDAFHSPQRSLALTPCSIIGCFLQLNLDREMVQTRMAIDERSCLGIELCRFCNVAKLSPHMSQQERALEEQCRVAIGFWNSGCEHLASPVVLANQSGEFCGVESQANAIYIWHCLRRIVVKRGAEMSEGGIVRIPVLGLLCFIDE